ncbi:hypothetical protein F1559_001122 [Cyanidiococcus yangmingshanensis]|uniref:Uncharacterized protein n=1 Tax=Cyanidiococcus yangmingshanensis TaxID=2690220 RepID=A0A7J7IP14_9RHOD|nr:hypothetical protein F1559_001122 [Cyanidiococcus yangmingshanensis]
MKSSSAPSSLVECAVYSLVAIVDALDEDDPSAALLDDSLYALLQQICERFLFDDVSPLPEQVTVNVGQLNMIHTGQLEEEKCSIAIIQLAARLGMVDLIARALGLKPPPASADATWFVSSTTAYRFNLRLAATEALFALAAQHPHDKFASDERRTGRLATRHNAAAAARATARLLTAQVEALYTAHRRRSGLCPLPYLMRMYVEYILFQAGQSAKQGDTPARQVVADLSDF